MVTSNIEVGGIVSAKIETFPISPDFYFLTGDSETGKSRLLHAFSRALGGDDKIALHCGEIMGYVRGLGRDLKVTDAVRPGKGELWYYSIQALDPSKIIDTGHVDPVRADRERIVRMAELVGVPMDFAPFMALVGGPNVFKELASPKTMACKSQVDTAESFKDDLDTAARATLKECDREEGLAAGLRQAIGDVDFETESDETQLNAAHEQAIRDEAALVERAKQATETRDKLGETAKTLEALRARPAIEENEARAAIETARGKEADANAALGSAAQGVTAAETAKVEAERAADATIKAIEGAKDAEVRAAEAAKTEALRAADAAIEAAKKARTEAVTAASATKTETLRASDAEISAAKQRKGDAAIAATDAATATRQAQAKLEELNERRAAIAKAELEVAQLGGTIAEPPTAEALETARTLVAAASKAKDYGVIVRQALKQRNEADAAAARAHTWKQRTETLRSWATGTWEILARALSSYLPEGMTIESGRLVQKQGGNKFFFDALSDGAKARIVMTLAARAAHDASNAEAAKSGNPARMPVLVFEQRFGESLPPNRRLEFRDLCRELKVCVYSAQCADGPLRVAVVGDDGLLQGIAA